MKSLRTMASTDCPPVLAYLTSAPHCLDRTLQGPWFLREKETWSQVLSFSGILRYPEDSHPNFITRQQRGHAAPDWPEGRKKEARKQRLQGPVCRSWWKICIIMSMYSHLFQHTQSAELGIPKEEGNFLSLQFPDSSSLGLTSQCLSLKVKL